MDIQTAVDNALSALNSNMADISLVGLGVLFIAATLWAARQLRKM